MISYKNARSVVSTLDSISRIITLDEISQTSIRELKEIFRKFSEINDELEKTTSLNVFKKRSLKKKYDETAIEFEKFAEKAVEKILEHFKLSFSELSMLYENANEKIGLNLEFKSPVLELPPGDILSHVNFLQEIATRYSKDSKKLKEAVVNTVRSLWESNNLKYKTYKRFISLDVDQIPISSQDTFPNKPIPDLINLYTQLRKEEEFLDHLKTRVRESYYSILLSRLNNIEAYLEAIKTEGVVIPSFIYAKLTSLRRDMTDKTDISSMQSFEKEISELEDLIRDKIRREILQIRHAIRDITEGIPNIPSPPQITGESLDKLIESLQETKAWKNEVFNALFSSIKETLQDLESSYDKLMPPLRTEVEGAIYNFRDTLAQLSKIEDAAFMYKKITKLLAQWKAALVKELVSSYDGYQRTLKLVREVLTHVPTFLQIELPENPQEKKFSELVMLLSSIREKTEKRDKIFRDALINELNRWKEQLMDIPSPYDQYFIPLQNQITEIVSKITTMTKTEEARLLYLRTTSELQRNLEKVFDELKERLLLKTRLALAKIPNPPDISKQMDKLNNFTLTSNFAESIKQLITFYENSIVSALKKALIENISGYIDVFSKLEPFGVTLETQKKQLETLLSQLEHTSDLEVIGEIGRQFRATISSSNVMNPIKQWINVMTSQMGRALEGITPSAGEIDSIISLISEGKSIDLTNPSQTIMYINKVIKVWDVVRSYIIKLEELEYKKFLESLNKVPNYDLVMRVYERHKEDFSEKVYPLLALESLRKKFRETETPDIVDLLFEIRRLERGWFEKLQEIISWHKVVRVLMAGFDYSLSPSEKKSKLKEIKKKIQATYSKPDVIAYLNWLVEIMAGM